MDFRQVQMGNHLDKARDIELSNLITLWIQNSYTPKVDFDLKQLFKDSNYTYFGKTTFKDQMFYRIRNSELSLVDYESIIGDSIRIKFIRDIIPQADKIKVQKGSKGCTTGSSWHHFKYQLLLPENAIEVKCHWKEKCDFMNKLIDKEYVAKYDILKKQYYP